MQDGFRIKLDIACFALFQTLIFAILVIEHFLIVSKAIWQIKLSFFIKLDMRNIFGSRRLTKNGCVSTHPLQGFFFAIYICLKFAT